MSSSFCSTQSTSRFPHSSTSLVFNLWRMVFLLMVVLKLHIRAVGNQQVPCYFIFGDSLADNGNNNFLSTSAKANYPPYGIDFPSGPTGRFCNGRTTTDIIAELLGFDNYIPAFYSARGTDILIGVNYASGSAGIRNETGQHLGDRICFNKQLQNHKIIVEQMANVLGNNESAARYLTKCLYSIGMGSNDYINNYFLPEHYPISREYTPEQYARVLMEQYSQQLRTLYATGARKIVLFGLGLIGCTPNAINSYGTNGSYCVDQMNYASKLFNIKLKSLVNRLNIDLADAKFIYIGSHRMGEVNGSVTGFKVPNSPCCQVTDIGQCIPNRIPCQNRNEYKFWDAFHPTEAANILTAVTTYSTLKSSDVYASSILHSSSLNQGAAAT